MELKPQTAQVVDLTAHLDPEAVQTSAGPVRWASVRIEYSLAGLSPTVEIRVPISGGESEAEGRAQALRQARLLIDHACRAAGFASDESVFHPVDVLIEEVEGISQELGLTDPTTQPKRLRRKTT